MGRKLSVLVFAAFALFLLLPIVYSFATTLFMEGTFWRDLHSINTATLGLLLKSSLIATAIALLSTGIGTFLAFLLYKTNVKFRNFFQLALLIPLFIPSYILAVAWKDFLRLYFHQEQIITSHLGLILVLTTVFTPLSTLIIGSALSNIDRHLEESGRLFTSLKNVILKIVLPLIKPALSTSFVLVFIFSISEFSVPAFFGIKVFTTEIFTQFSAFYNHSLAMMQSAFLIILCIFLLLIERKHISKAPFFSVSSKGSQSQLLELKNWHSLGLFILFSWFVTTTLLPFFTLLKQTSSGGFPTIVKAFNLLKPTFFYSIRLALTAAILMLIIGFTSAYQSTRHPSRLSRIFEFSLLFLFAIPSTAWGISLITFYNHPLLNFIYANSSIILIGYIGKFTFIASKLIGNNIQQIPHSLEEAAQIAGLSFYTRIWKILLPQIMSGLLAAFIISFIFSLGELGTTIMLYPPGTELMPIKVFTIMANAPQALTSAMTLIIFSITLLLLLSLFGAIRFFSVYFRKSSHSSFHS